MTVLSEVILPYTSSYSSFVDFWYCDSFTGQVIIFCPRESYWGPAMRTSYCFRNPAVPVGWCQHSNKAVCLNYTEVVNEFSPWQESSPRLTNDVSQKQEWEKLSFENIQSAGWATILKQNYDSIFLFMEVKLSITRSRREALWFSVQCGSWNMLSMLLCCQWKCLMRFTRCSQSCPVMFMYSDRDSMKWPVIYLAGKPGQRGISMLHATSHQANLLSFLLRL